MTFRPRLLLSVLLLATVASVALLAAPAIARADTLSWTLQYAGPPNIPNGDADPIPVAAGFNAVSFADSTHGWAVGLRVNNAAPQGGGTALGFYATTADGGASWTHGDFGTAELNAVLARSTTDVWAVGAAGTIIHWDGTTWSSRTVTGWSSTKAFRAVAFSDDANGWVVGDGLGIAKTTDGGTSWTLVAAPDTGATLRSLAVLTTTSVVAVGDGGTLKVLGTSGVGPTLVIASVALYGVTFANASTGWAVGDGPTVLRTTDGGATWSPAGTLPLPAGWTEPDRANLKARAVAFSGPMNGIVTGFYQTVWRTSDGGGTWEAEAIYDPGTLDDCELRGVAFTPGSADGPVVVSRRPLLDTDFNKARAYKGAWSGRVNTCTLTYTAGSGGTIAGVSPQTVAYGGSGTAVTAVPATGYHFVSWSDGIATATRTDSNVTANKSVTANFAINTYTLTYTAGSGGTISGTSPQTVNHNGSGMAVTAVPSTGYHFVSWSDGVLTAARTDSNVTANKSVTANFAVDAPDTRTLTYGAGPGGTITGTSPQTVVLGGSGTVVTAIANTGYHFTSWSDGVLTTARTDANVTVDKSVTANFAINTYTLHYNAATGGTISGTADQTVAYGGSGTAVTAAPATGYHFVAWSDGVATAARTDTNVTADHTMSATFSALPPVTFTITPSAGAHGSISPSTPQTVASGADLAFTIKPDIGYRVASVLVGGVSVGAVTSYTFNNVTANGTISATFASTLTRTTIGIVANHSSVPRGHPVYFHGVISPNRTSTHVGFYMRKAGSTTWKLVSTRHTFSGHHWSYPSYHPSTRGTYYFQVRLSATSKYASSTSKTIKVVWR
jgi:photosystem II stability/assembly factor-like uncharacterized protein